MRFIFVICIILALFGCHKKNKIINTIPNESWVEEIESEVEPEKQLDMLKPISDVKFPGIEQAVIYFDFDRAEIRADQVAVLDMFSVEANRSPTRPIKIEGYCCPIGTEIYNYRLGLCRGKAVSAYLSQYIKNPIEIISYGERNLVTDNPEKYFLNRRVLVYGNGKK